MNILKRVVWPIAIGTLLISGKVAAAQDNYIKPAPIIQKQATPEKSLERVVESALVTVDVKDANIKDVLVTAAKASHSNIAIAPDVEGKVTLYLTEQPFERILDITTSMQNLTWKKDYGIYFVEKKKEEPKQEIQQEKKVQRIFIPQNYDAIVSPFATAIESFRQLRELQEEVNALADAIIGQNSPNRWIQPPQQPINSYNTFIFPSPWYCPR